MKSQCAVTMVSDQSAPVSDELEHVLRCKCSAKASLLAEFRVEKHKKIFFFACEAVKETLPFMATFVVVWQYKQSFSQGKFNLGK